MSELHRSTVYLWDYEEPYLCDNSTVHKELLTAEKPESAEVLEKTLIDAIVAYLHTEEGQAKDDPDDDFNFYTAFDTIPESYWQQHGILKVNDRIDGECQEGVRLVVNGHWAYNQTRGKE